MLIHFAHARKLKSGDGPALHNATTAKDALSLLEESAPSIGAVYASLCDYTHPASASVFRFAGERTHPDKVTFDPRAGRKRMQEILNLSAEVGPVALALGVPPAIMTLKVLNSFAFGSVATPWADGVSLGFSGVWRELERRLNLAAAPRAATGAERDRILAELEAQYRPVGKARRRGKVNR